MESSCTQLPYSKTCCSPELHRVLDSIDSSDDDGLSIVTLVEQLEIILIRTALERTRGSKGNAAGLLGITRQRLHKKIKRYEL